MGAMASQITSLTIVYFAVYSRTDLSKHQSSASLAFVHKWPVMTSHEQPWKPFMPWEPYVTAIKATSNSHESHIKQPWKNWSYARHT